MNVDVIIVYARSAQKDLRKLESSDSSRIVKKIDCFVTSAKPLQNAKAMSGIFAGKYRYRIGNYRVIFTYDSNGKVAILSILHIGHRKDIYK